MNRGRIFRLDSTGLQLESSLAWHDSCMQLINGQEQTAHAGQVDEAQEVLADSVFSKVVAGSAGSANIFCSLLWASSRSMHLLHDCSISMNELACCMQNLVLDKF